jgi:hypothetical protein
LARVPAALVPIKALSGKPRAGKTLLFNASSN